MSLFDRLRLAESRPRPNTSELGDSGVGYMATTGKARRLRDTEYLYDLRGANAYRIYDRMRFSDPKVNGLRSAQNLPVLRASVAIEPADADDKDAVAKAEFVEEALLKNFPWRAFLADTLLASDFGFAPFEIIWKVEDGKVGIDRLALRPPSSIAAEDIVIENGTVSRVTQRPVTGGSYEIPGEKLIWFCYGKEGDDFRGRPILRPMYKPWKLKEELEVELAVLIRKGGGIPDITTQGIVDDKTAAELDAAAADFGIAEGAFVRHSDDVAVALISSNAAVAEVLSAIRYFDTQLSQVCMAQVLDLGTNQIGSRALGTTLSDMFSDSIQALCSYREDVLNARGGLIHQLVDYNFPSDDNLPKLRFGNVQRNDLRAMAEAFLKLNQAGMEFGEEVWDWVRDEMNLPAAEADDAPVPVNPVAPEKTAPPAPSSRQAPRPGAAGGAEPESGARASEHSCEGLTLAELRAPRGVECYVDLAEVAGRFDDARTAVRDATEETRAALVAELGRRARAAADKGALAKFAAGAPPMVDRLAADVREVLRDFYAAGRRQVADELQRQRDGEPLVEETLEARGAGQRELAEKPKRGRGRKPADPEALIGEQAEAAARGIAAAAQAAAVAQAARKATVPLTDAAFDEAVSRETIAVALRFGGLVSDVMQWGRHGEALEQRTDIADAVYSALLDGACCEECEPMDGEETTDLDEAAGWTPNPDCLGGDRCRCVTVYELRQEASA